MLFKVSKSLKKGGYLILNEAILRDTDIAERKTEIKDQELIVREAETYDEAIGHWFNVIKRDLLRYPG